jgi:putative DNA primase/helicase
MITVRELAGALGARGDGPNWSCCCPAHDDRHPSLSVTESNGRVLLYCHRGCAFTEIVTELERRGLWPVEVDASEPTNPLALDQELLARVIELNDQLVPPPGTRTARYLASRGLDVNAMADIGHHRGLWHPWTGTTWPAMAACVRNGAGEPIGFHRTWLRHDRPGKAPVSPVRAMLGHARGGAIRLAPAGPVLVIAEGLETAAAAALLSGLPAWSAVSASNLPHVDLPALVREVIIAADADAPGLRAATLAAQRWTAEGRSVRIIKPRHHNDFNDELMETAG